MNLELNKYKEEIDGVWTGKSYRLCFKEGGHSTCFLLTLQEKLELEDILARNAYKGI